MSFNYDTRSSNTLTTDAKSNAGSFTNDNRASTSLTKDNRSNAGSFTNDARNSGLNFGLWSSTIFSWALQFPWLATSIGNTLLKDVRN